MNRKPFLPSTRRAILFGAPAAFVLTGCGSLIGPSGPPPQIYVLAPTLGPINSAPTVNWQLSIVRPDAPDVYDTQRIVIERNQILDYYADSQWADTTEPLLQRALVEGFEKSGRINAVARASSGIKADFLLQTEVRSFMARYDGTNPTASVELIAKMVTPGRIVLATLDSKHEVVSTANSVPAAIDAFNSAVTQCVEEIVAWTLQTGAAAPATEATPATPKPARHSHHG